MVKWGNADNYVIPVTTFMYVCVCVKWKGMEKLDLSTPIVASRRHI